MCVVSNVGDVLGEPDCENDEKMEVVRKVLAAFNIDLDEVLS